MKTLKREVIYSNTGLSDNDLWLGCILWHRFLFPYDLYRSRFRDEGLEAQIKSITRDEVIRMLELLISC